MATLQFSEEAARRLEITYSSPDIRGQRDEVLRRLALKPGERVIDIGCGPGLLCDSMANVVSPAGHVLGVDISADLIALARKRNSRPWLEYEAGDAMVLAAGDAHFDVAVHMQVLEYLPDPDRALREMARVLKSGGRAVAVSTDWDAVVWHSDNPKKMKKVLRAWESHCANPRMPRMLGPRLNAAGFSLLIVSGYPIINTRLGEDTYSDGLSRLIIEFVQRQKLVSLDELQAWAGELRTLSDNGRYFFSTMRYLFMVAKPR